ncbi:MAG: hypothetical protein NZ870_03255 [bacterium]|nr:hypothetical protein [bacterium]
MFFYSFFILFTFLYSEEFNIYTQKGREVIKILREISTKVGLETELNELLNQDSITRLDIADFANKAIKIAEEKNIDIEGADFLIKEFDTEFLVLNIQYEISNQKENLRLLEILTARIKFETELGAFVEKLSGEFPVTEKEKILYGLPPKEPPLSIAHQLRFIIKGQENNISFYLGLRNFGYWGVGRYTSGSIGIGFSSQDPLQIEEGYIRYKKNTFETKIGRRYFRYGIYGMLFEGNYEANDALNFNIKLPYLRIYTDILNKYDAADTYISNLRIGKRNFLDIGYLFTAYRNETKSLFGINDFSRVGISGRFHIYKIISIEGDFIKTSSEDKPSYALAIGLKKNKFFNFIRYVELNDAPEPIPINRSSIELSDFNYLRNKEDSKAINPIFGYKFKKIQINYEYLHSSFEATNETNIIHRLFLEAEFNPNVNGALEYLYNYPDLYSIIRFMIRFII